jgi:hypothetical protein
VDHHRGAGDDEQADRGRGGVRGVGWVSKAKSITDRIAY